MRKRTAPGEEAGCHRDLPIGEEWDRESEIGPRISVVFGRQSVVAHVVSNPMLDLEMAPRSGEPKAKAPVQKTQLFVAVETSESGGGLGKEKGQHLKRPTRVVFDEPEKELDVGAGEGKEHHVMKRPTRVMFDEVEKEAEGGSADEKHHSWRRPISGQGVGG